MKYNITKEDAIIIRNMYNARVSYKNISESFKIPTLYVGSTLSEHIEKCEIFRKLTEIGVDKKRAKTMAIRCHYAKIDTVDDLKKADLFDTFGIGSVGVDKLRLVIAKEALSTAKSRLTKQPREWYYTYAENADADLVEKYCQTQSLIYTKKDIGKFTEFSILMNESEKSRMVS